MKEEVAVGNYTLQFGWVSTLEDAAFRSPSRDDNAFIFNLTDTTEAGTGEYTMQFTTQPFTLSRDGITTLGLFGVGKFGPVTDVIENTEDIPKEYSISQNFPNPFNPSATIKYTLPGESLVRIKIYDVLGREIKTLVDRKESSGKHAINFEASDLSSGIYLYQFYAEGSGSNIGQVFIRQKKMILVK